MDEPYYPATAFYFDLAILGARDTSTEIDGSFAEISGIDRELEVQSLPEGGENRFAHQLPRRGKHPNLVLKRGLVSEKSALATWAETTIGSLFAKPVEPRAVLVTLRRPDGEPLVMWRFDRAYPVKWSTGAFDALKGQVAVETFELAYATVTRATTAVGFGRLKFER